MSKSRYFLEQSIPELDDLLKKGLFEKEEITHIIKKRTDFEHRIASRGSKSRDYLKYIEFEKNLEKLRKKRYVRLNTVGLVNTKPSISDWSQSRRILFIFDRSIKKFPNDLLLWENYLIYLKSEKLFKKIYKVYNQLLKLHPNSIESWIDAASFEFNVIGSAKNARILYQKSLRFNNDSIKLWLSYFTFELNYISKLLSRRQILGLITERQQLENDISELQKVDIDDEDKELIQLDSSDLKDELNQLPDADLNMLGSPETNPALKGDIALTIYDIMIDSLIKNKKSRFGLNYNQFNEFEFIFENSTRILKLIKNYNNLNRVYLSNHIINKLLNLQLIPSTIILDITLFLEYDDSNLIDNLQSSTKKYFAYKSKLNDENEKELKNLYINYIIENFISNDNIDETTKKIINSIIKKL